MGDYGRGLGSGRLDPLVCSYANVRQVTKFSTNPSQFSRSAGRSDRPTAGRTASRSGGTVDDESNMNVASTPRLFSVNPASSISTSLSLSLSLTGLFSSVNHLRQLYLI